jgi:cell wall-associated NlpC family hydrolase
MLAIWGSVRELGVKLPRVSRSQFNNGRNVPISDLRPGDLVFFRNGGGPIHHVAMYIGNDRMVVPQATRLPVAPSPVRKTTFGTRHVGC